MLQEFADPPGLVRQCRVDDALLVRLAPDESAGEQNGNLRPHLDCPISELPSVRQAGHDDVRDKHGDGPIPRGGASRPGCKMAHLPFS